MRLYVLEARKESMPERSKSSARLHAADISRLMRTGMSNAQFMSDLMRAVSVSVGDESFTEIDFSRIEKKELEITTQV